MQQQQSGNAILSLNNPEHQCLGITVAYFYHLSSKRIVNQIVMIEDASPKKASSKVLYQSFMFLVKKINNGYLKEFISFLL